MEEKVFISLLPDARKGNKQVQKLLLDAMYESDYRILISLMNPEDKEWLMEIALIGNVFAAWCLVWGMNRRMIAFKRSVGHQVVCEPVFVKSQADEDRMWMEKIGEKVKDTSTEMLSSIWHTAHSLGEGLNYLPLLHELDRRYDTETDDYLVSLCLEAIERLGDIYTWGEEELGVLRDTQKANLYYERCGSENVWD